MGDDGSDVSYVSFLVFQLSQSSFGMMFWYVFGICFGTCFDDVLVYVYMYMDVNSAMKYVIKLQ